MLRYAGEGTAAFSALNADLDEQQWSDISRYLDVTRSEMVFARKVLLVEGLAEQMLMPRIAADLEIDLDGAGISVCGIGGVNFEPYVRFLRALGTPHAVITDGDPRGPRNRTGERRLEVLATSLEGAGAEPIALGLFHGTHTFEIDLVEADEDNRRSVLETLDGFDWGPRRDAELQNALNGEEFSDERLMVFIEAVAKGRFAQRLAAEAGALVAPPYIVQALEYLGE